MSKFNCYTPDLLLNDILAVIDYPDSSPKEKLIEIKSYAHVFRKINGLDMKGEIEDGKEI